MTTNGTTGTKLTGAAAKAARQARTAKLLEGTELTMSDEERAMRAATSEATNQAERPRTGSPRDPKPAKPKVEKQPKAEKPAVDRLARVVESQQSPTMWQYARIAKQIKQRIDAGQSASEATLQVMDQVVEIVSGILAQEPATASDSDIDGATKSYFEQVMPKSMQRQRGPRESGESTTGK